jgi:hypothetical protein
LRFFSKIVFVCNLCFAVSAILRLVEKDHITNGNHDAIIPLPPVQGTLVILGLIAVMLSFIFALLCGMYFLLKKQHNIAKWLVWVNLLFLLFQLFYFKLY